MRAAAPLLFCADAGTKARRHRIKPERHVTLKIDDVAFTSPDMAATTAFVTRAFGRNFNDDGPDYQDLANAGLSGGIAAGKAAPRWRSGTDR
ncbi:MAG: hypothetical protein ACK41U_10135 [Paracoccus sp. (in: a-proteobacteria)]|uniref:hypothetical protein n=1 Tax=Paracoccus sp. TaxID=267 RepID=UPI00391CA39D